MRVFIYLFIYLFISCTTNNKNETLLKSKKTVLNLKIDTIPITKLPYSFKYIYDSISTQSKSIDSFLKKKLINKESKLNNLFSDSTSFSSKETLNIVKYINFPYSGNAYFFKKLPNLNEIKLLLFIYENKNHDYNLPYFELQTFNKENKNIDKLIVAGAREYECSWDRSFSIDKNYLITISNIESCYDIEEEKKIDKKEYLIQYKINKKGLFKIIKKTDVNISN